MQKTTVRSNPGSPRRAGSSRARALGTALALALTLPLAGAANAIAIGSTIQLPVDAGTAASVDLGAAPSGPAAGFPSWVRLHPFGPSDPFVDFGTGVDGDSTGIGEGTPGDAWVYEITFDFAWNGTAAGSAPGAHAEQILFTLVDSRFGTGGSISGTSDLAQSGFLPGTFQVDGDDVTPEIVVADTGAMSGSAQGFVTDTGVGVGNRWLGFWLPADDQPHEITMRWALGQMPSGAGEIFFPTAAFLAVPEPGAAVLLGAALALALGGAQARRTR